MFTLKKLSPARRNRLTWLSHVIVRSFARARCRKVFFVCFFFFFCARSRSHQTPPTRFARLVLASERRPQSCLPLSAPQKLIRKIRSPTDLARLRRQVRPRSQARHVAEARRCSFLQFRSRSSPLFRFRRARGTCYAELIEGARSRHYLVNNQKVDRTATHVRRILRACADGDAGRFRAPFSQPPACTQVRLYTR